MAEFALGVAELGTEVSLEGLSKGIKDAEGEAQSGFSRIGDIIGGALKTGVMAAGAGLVAAIGGIVKGVASNAEFERFETQFGVLLGNTEKAKQRLDELAQFGATTPFELPELVKADKVLTAFGLHAEDTAKRFGVSGEQILTTIGDVAAGTGVSFEELSITFGKFASGATGEAIARFQELGIATREEMAGWGLEFSKSGQLLTPAREAFTILEAHVRDKFGGMMAAQSGTFEGMLSNLQDWAGATLRTVSKPIFEPLKGALKSLLETLNSPAVQQGIQNIAGGIAKLVQNAITGGKVLVELGKQAYAWGANIAGQFARGIMQAAAPVIQALQYIGSIIRSWLQPGSPPKLLPQLDEWGAGAATAYMDGWKDADFSAFRSLSSAIEQELKTLVDLGQLSEVDVAPTLARSQEQLARAISTVTQGGEIQDDMWNDLIGAMGPAGPQVANLVRSYFDLERATQQVEQAQRELTEVTERYDAALRPLNDQLQGIRDRKREIQDMQRVQELQEQLASGELSEADAELARLEIAEIQAEQQIDSVERERDAAVEAAQAKVDAAEQAQQAAQAQVQVQQGLLDQGQATNQLLIGQGELLDRLAKAAETAAKGAAGGAAALGAALPALDIPEVDPEAIAAPFTEVADQVAETQARINGMVQSVSERLQPLLTAFDTVKQHLTDILAVVSGVVAGFAAFSILSAVVPVILSFGASLEAAGGILGLIVALLGGPVTIAIGAAAAMIGLFTAAWVGNWGDIQGVMAGVVAQIMPMLETFWQKVQLAAQNLMPAWDALGVTIGKLSPIFTAVAAVVGTVVVALVGAIGDMLPGAAMLLNGALTAVMGVVNLVADVVVGLVTLIGQLLTGQWAAAWETAKTLVSNVVLDILQVIGGLIQGVFGLIGGLVGGVIGFFRNLYEVIVGHSIIPDLVDGIIAWIEKLPGTVLGLIAGLVSNAVAKFEQLASQIAGVLETIASVFGTKLQEVTATWSRVFEQLPGIITNLRDRFLTAGRAIIDGVIAGVQAAAGALMSALSNIAGDALQAAKDALGIQSPSRVFAEVGDQVIAGWLEGMESSFPDLLSSFAAMGEELADLAKKIKDTISDTMADIFEGGADLIEQRTKNREFVASLGKDVAKAREKNTADIAKTEAALADAREQEAERQVKLQGQIADKQKALQKELSLAAEKQDLEKIADLQKDLADLERDRATPSERVTELENELALLRQQSAELAERERQMESFRQRQSILLQQAEKVAAQLFKDDPVQQANFFQLRSKQLQDIAKLEEDWFAARTQAERDQIEATIRDKQKQHELELAAFMQRAQQENVTFGDLQKQYEDLIAKRDDLTTKRTDKQTQLAKEKDARRRAEIEREIADLDQQIAGTNALIDEMQQILDPLAGIVTNPPVTTPGLLSGGAGLAYPILPGMQGMAAGQMAGAAGGASAAYTVVLRLEDERSSLFKDIIRATVKEEMAEAGWRGDTRKR
jgi:hypothetical protein